MYKRNNGMDDREILQNQFTAYVKRAVHNRRIRYLVQRDKYTRMEGSLTEIEPYAYDTRDNIQSVMDFEALRESLQSIREKERYIILARVVEEKSVNEIAVELGISYRAVTSLYYRGMKKLREMMEGGENI